MTDDAEFVHGKKYRCKVLDGCGWDRARTRTPFFRVYMVVTGGAMENAKLIREVYFTAKSEEQAIEEFQAAFGLNLRSVNLRELDKLILGKEVAAQVEIQKRQDGKGETIRASRLIPVTDLVSGGIETEVADLLGNVATPAPPADGFSDQF